MAVKDFEDKSLKNKNETKTEIEQDYFFPDLYGQSITVKATSLEEAERKAKALINKLKK